MNVNICLATDTKYAPYCGTTILSIKEHISKEHDYRIYVLFDRLSIWYRTQMELLSDVNFTVKCVDIHDLIHNTSFREINHLSIAAIYRIIIPRVFDNLDKVLYLDSDVIVNCDVADLFSIDLDDSIIGAVRGKYDHSIEKFMLHHICDVLKIEEKSYFNSGVLLINVKEYNDFNVAEKSLKLLNDRNDLIYADQDALNIICEGKVFFLSEYWNHEVVVYSEMNETYRYKVDYIDFQNYGVIHYDGEIKPWNEPDSVLSEVFWKYAKRIVFYEDILNRMNAYTTRKTNELYDLLRGYKRIAIYGAGKIGKRYVKWIMMTGVCRISVWIDRDMNVGMNSQMPVVSLEQVDFKGVDGVLIAIENANAVEEVKFLLVGKGIDDQKIITIHNSI